MSLSSKGQKAATPNTVVGNRTHENEERMRLPFLVF